MLVSPETPRQLEITLRKSETVSPSESLVNRSKIQLSFQTQAPCFPEPFHANWINQPLLFCSELRLLKCKHLLRKVKESFLSYTKCVPGCQDVADSVNHY